MDLVEFLTARLDEDEQAATAPAATAGGLLHSQWDVRDHRGMAAVFVANRVYRLADDVPDDVAAHIARHDPARVLADAAAKRRLIERYIRAVAATPSVSSYVRGQDDGYRQACLDAIRDAAEIHADHPDYREEWKP